MNAPERDFFEKLRTGDSAAVSGLTAALYDELHRIASRQMRGERPSHTLQATALVHEAFLKLFDGSQQKYTNEIHFLAVASRVMRQILVDYARGRRTQKRAGGAEPYPAGMDLEIAGERGIELIDLIELDRAIQALAAEDEGLARLIEMRYFGGMTAEQTAEALGLSVHVVRHNLRLAHAWLRRKLNTNEGSSSAAVN